jgi:2-haloacid dehalogenase
MHNNIHAIIFDFGGVLINWEPRLVFQKFFPGDPEAVESFMAEIRFADWNLQQDRGYPFEQAVTELTAQFPQYGHIIQDYDISWEESISGIIPGTVKLLEELKSQGYPIYGLTNWNHDKFSLVKQKYGFFHLFESILVSGEVKLVKPDPAIYNLLLSQIKQNPENCVMIDDSVKNIDASRELGFISILFISPEQLREELTRLHVL